MAGDPNPIFSNANLKTTTPRVLPEAARQMLETLGGMFPKLVDRRKVARKHYEAAGFITTANKQVAEFYTYDLNAYTLGFVSTSPIPTGTFGTASVDLPDGGRFEIGGRVMRCREFKPGCYEGYINFATNLPMATITAAAA